MLKRILVVLLTGIALTTVACSASSNENRDNEITTDPALIAEALDFGGIVLPEDAQVLGMQHSLGIDKFYVLAVALPPTKITELISASGFAASLQPGHPGMPPLKGYSLEDKANIVLIQDRRLPEGEQKSTVVREIAVDQTDPARSVAHVWFFTL